MDFPASFLLLLHEIALGGLFAIAATPFHELERGFYKSTAAVLFIIGLLGLWGKLNLHLRAPGGLDISAGGTMLFHALFMIFFALYLVSLWGERPLFRARVFSVSLLAGLISLTLSSVIFHQGRWSFETLFYPLSSYLSAFLLGGASVGMLLGHWYLIDTGQSIRPFLRIFWFFVISLIAQTVFHLMLPLALYWLGNAETVAALEQLWENHRVLLTTRVLVAQVGPLILSYMIWRTLQIPHTMAATGLFYIALLGVFVGEILGKQILSLTSLPF